MSISRLLRSMDHHWLMSDGSLTHERRVVSDPTGPHRLACYKQLRWESALTGAGQMVGFAEQLGLDIDAFNQCFESRGYREAVEDQMREAFGHGFHGTPSFMINDTPLAGPPTYEYLISVIEGQLN